MGDKVNDYIVKWRREEGHAHKDDVAFSGYERDNYLINAKVPRFGSGEAKGILGESVRGKDDLISMVDVCNYSLTYSLTGHVNHMSPDDHFQNLKRVIAAVGGKATPDQRDHALPLREPPAQEKPPGIPGLRPGPAGAGADGRGQYHHL